MNLEFKNFLTQLCKTEKDEVILKKIDSSEKLIPLLLKRGCSDNLKFLVDIIKQSLYPSVCSKIVSEEIDSLFIKIEKEPKLLFDKTVQNKIIELTTTRFEKDKQVVIKKADDISKLIILMEGYLTEAILVNNSGTKNVLNIKDKIQSINIQENGLENLTKLQNELINATICIEKEMSDVTDKLKNGKDKVLELEEKVKNLEEELSRVKTENMKDHLTGLLTRKAFSEEAKKIENFFEKLNKQYAVIFLDLDNFKKLNDTYGHECGDIVLSTFGKILSKSIREKDIVGRYGGEEFVVIIQFNLHRELLQFLRRIKDIVIENSFLYKEQKIKVTFSAGVAVRSNFNSYENTLQKADMLLYKAKEKGRNKVILETGEEI